MPVVEALIDQTEFWQLHPFTMLTERYTFIVHHLGIQKYRSVHLGLLFQYRNRVWRYFIYPLALQGWLHEMLACYGAVFHLILTVGSVLA